MRKETILAQVTEMMEIWKINYMIEQSVQITKAKNPESWPLDQKITRYGQEKKRAYVRIDGVTTQNISTTKKHFYSQTDMNDDRQHDI